MACKITQHCDRCSREITQNNFARHSAVCKGAKAKKIRGLDFDPNSGYKDGTRVAWNKGIRSKPDLRNPEFIGKLGGYRPNAGRSKKFHVTDSFGTAVCLQSTFELKCSEILDELGIRWIRPKSLIYDNRRYFPDFYLVDYDIFLDPKNDYLAKIDQVKIDKVIEQNNVKVYILTEEKINDEYIKRLCS